MANAKSNITYIDGTTSTVNDSTIYQRGGSLVLGQKDSTDLNYTAGTDIMRIDVALGNKDANSELIGSISDRAPNLPSGYAATGTPTYGDGKQNKVTTWADDYAPDKDNAKLNYKTPKSSTSVKFADLK